MGNSAESLQEQRQQYLGDNNERVREEKRKAELEARDKMKDNREKVESSQRKERERIERTVKGQNNN